MTGGSRNVSSEISNFLPRRGEILEAQVYQEKYLLLMAGLG
jgi:hypothetical protein